MSRCSWQASVRGPLLAESGPVHSHGQHQRRGQSNPERMFSTAGIRNAFIIDVIGANQLTYGGGLSGFVVPEGRAAATEPHRKILEGWCLLRPEVRTVEIGPLVDAWHSDVAQP